MDADKWRTLRTLRILPLCGGGLGRYSRGECQAMPGLRRTPIWQRGRSTGVFQERGLDPNISPIIKIVGTAAEAVERSYNRICFSSRNVTLGVAHHGDYVLTPAKL